MSQDEIEDVDCTLVGETTQAWQLRDSIVESRVAWFPKSQVSFKRLNKVTKEAVAEVPLWLLNAKGWN